MNNNKNITRNALEPSFAEDQLSAAKSPAVSLLSNVSRSPTPTPSPRSNWNSLRNTSYNSRLRINPRQNNPPNHHRPDRSNSSVPVFYIEAYISSFHPSSQVILKLTPKTIIKLVQKHRLNYSGNKRYRARSRNILKL
ncbi:hypothetical protein AO1008_04340 [Aspergillus oryzae 100-8]|nr:hypothetical protein AO1008_04340 [Aspergillus oryzae 100-8]